MSCGFAKQKQEHELMYDNNGPSDDKEQDWEKPFPFMHCSLFIVLILKIALLKLLKKFFY